MPPVAIKLLFKVLAVSHPYRLETPIKAESSVLRDGTGKENRPVLPCFDLNDESCNFQGGMVEDSQ